MENVIKEVLDEYARHNFYSDVVRLRVAREINDRLSSSSGAVGGRPKVDGKPKIENTLVNKVDNSSKDKITIGDDAKTSASLNIKGSKTTFKDSIKYDKNKNDVSKKRSPKTNTRKPKTNTRKPKNVTE